MREIAFLMVAGTIALFPCVASADVAQTRRDAATREMEQFKLEWAEQSNRAEQFLDATNIERARLNELATTARVSTEACAPNELTGDDDAVITRSTELINLYDLAIKDDEAGERDLENSNVRQGDYESAMQKYMNLVAVKERLFMYRTVYHVLVTVAKISINSINNLCLIRRMDSALGARDEIKSATLNRHHILNEVSRSALTDDARRFEQGIHYIARIQ